MTAPPPPAVTIGVDPGSAHVGLVAAIDGRPVVARTLSVDPAEVGPAVAEILRVALDAGAVRLVTEWAPFYCRLYPGEDPQRFAARFAAQERNREVQVAIRALIEHMCDEAGIAHATILPQTARARVGAKIERLEGDKARKSRMDAAVRSRLLELLGPDDAAKLHDAHQRDAMVAILGDLARPVVVARTPRTPRAPVERKERPAVSETLAGRILEAMAVHGRPIRHDVLAVRVAAMPTALACALRSLVGAERIRKVSRGVYELAA